MMIASKKNLKWIALSVLFTAATFARADDEDHLAKAPAAVQATVKKNMGDGKLEGCATLTEDGKTAYDIDMSIGGSAYAILVAEDGTIIQREVELQQAMVPPEVIDTGTKTHPDAKIGEASIITHGDKMFYELEMHIGKDEHDVEITADGKLLSDTVAKPEAADPNEKKDAAEKKD